jgi:hypothetical protein
VPLVVFVLDVELESAEGNSLDAKRSASDTWSYILLIRSGFMVQGLGFR